jgi:hypothetical protein
MGGERRGKMWRGERTCAGAMVIRILSSLVSNSHTFTPPPHSDTRLLIPLFIIFFSFRFLDN